jgi:hypothetical protein
MDDRALLLIKEASRIATQINNDRLCGIVPESDLTIRLTEVTDLMMDICIGGDPDAMMEEDDDGRYGEDLSQKE